MKRRKAENQAAFRKGAEAVAKVNDKLWGGGIAVKRRPAPKRVRRGPHQGHRECERRRTPGGFAGTGGA